MRGLLLLLLAAGCASYGGLVPGQSTAADVEAVMGPAADKRAAAGGQTVYYYPSLPFGYATYAARIAPDGKLIALEQRLTPENMDKLKPGVTRAEEVLDLLGPPYRPMKQATSGEEIWTYPFLIPGFPLGRWFVVHISPDGMLREKNMIDDPTRGRR
jgi:hypothetical protein